MDPGWQLTIQHGWNNSNKTPEKILFKPYATTMCPACGEAIMATKVVQDEEKAGLCYMCAGGPYHQVEGRGIATVSHGK